MRLYIGIDLPPTVKESLFQTQLQLKKLGLKGSWKAPEYLHITLEFLGELPAESVPILSQLIKAVVNDKKVFKLHIDKLGAFPSFQRAHTLWAGVGGHVEKLDELWIAMHIELEKNGFKLQKAAFNPHISLVSRPNMSLVDLNVFPFEKTGDFTVSEVILFESKVEVGKRIYPQLYRAGMTR